MTLLERDQGSVRWLQPTTSQVILNVGLYSSCSCTLSQEALSMHTKQERTGIQPAEWSRRVGGGVPTLFPLFFSLLFSFSSYLVFLDTLCQLVQTEA